MKVILFAKKNKPNIDKVIKYLRNKSDVIVYQGGVSDAFPRIKRDSFDLLISYLSPWIIPGAILNKAKMGCINFHPGSPKYPGIGCFNFAIYNGDKKYGVVAHIMEEKVDSGRIIGAKFFPLSVSDSVYSLSVKSYAFMFKLFCEVMDYIFKFKEFPNCRETWKRKPYKRSELENLCRVNFNMSKKEIENRIKATRYPSMPGAYVELFGNKFEYNPER
jgi:methionyl-tRNA formyltransferase